VTPEGAVKKAVKKVLDDMGCYYFMAVQSGYGRRTLDFLVCHKGCFLGIETKAAGGKLTPLQKVCIKDIEAAGGECITIDSVEAASHLRHWIETHNSTMLGVHE